MDDVEFYQHLTKIINYHSDTEKNEQKNYIVPDIVRIVPAYGTGAIHCIHRGHQQFTGA